MATKEKVKVNKNNGIELSQESITDTVIDPVAVVEPVEVEAVTEDSEERDMVYALPKELSEKKGIFGKRREKPPNANCLIIRRRHGRYEGSWEYQDDPIGVPVKYKGAWTYVFTAHKQGQEEILKPLPVSGDFQLFPEELWDALVWDDYKKWLTAPLSTTEKLKIGLALGFLGISAGLTFLIVVSLAG